MFEVTILTSQKTSKGKVLAVKVFETETDCNEFINQCLKHDRTIDWNVEIVE